MCVCVCTHRSPQAGAAEGSLPVPGESGWSGDRSLSATWSADYWSTQVSRNKIDVSLKKKKKMYTMLCFKCLYIFEVHKFCALFCINVNFFVTNIVLINILKRKEEDAQARGLPVGLSGRRSRSGATPACSPPGRARAASASSRCREVTSSVGCWTI